MDEMFPHKPLHREAADLLNLLQHAELLESKTLAEIEAILQKSGYKKTGIGDVTIGWGRRVDGDHAHDQTSVLIKTSDDHLVELQLGGMGSYALTVHARNAKDMSPKEAKSVLSAFHLNEFVHVSAKTPRFLQSVEHAKQRYPDLNEEIRRRIEKLFS